MHDTILKEVSTVDLNGAVEKFIPESIGKLIEKRGDGIYPLQNVFIRKVKVLKKPRFDLTKLMELYADGGEDSGAAMDKISAENTVKKLEGAGGRL